MIEANWMLFLAASVVVIATPGQDMILVMSKSLAQGARAGVATAAGVSVGLVGHTLLATLGLGALLRASDWVFTALKLVGAAYLVYLGLQLLHPCCKPGRGKHGPAIACSAVRHRGGLQHQQPQDRGLRTLPSCRSSWHRTRCIPRSRSLHLAWRLPRSPSSSRVRWLCLPVRFRRGSARVQRRCAGCTAAAASSCWGLPFGSRLLGVAMPDPSFNRTRRSAQPLLVGLRRWWRAGKRERKGARAARDALTI